MLFLKMDTRVENKVTLISDTLKEFFGNKTILARIKFFGLFISALCKVQTVCSEKLACGFDSSVKSESSLLRIQRFVAEYSPEKESWYIESAFNALKSSGFNIEDTHLTDIDRVCILLSLVLIAFAWVYKQEYISIP